MRDIKFRAWIYEKKKMVVVDGLDSENIIYKKDGQSILVSLPDCLLMQYIGLKDSDGKEIYEGDIVRCCYGDGKSATSEWHQDMVSYLAEGYGCPSFDLHTASVLGIASTLSKETHTFKNAIAYYLNYGRLEVIGNVYENPELLEEKE